MPVDLSSKIKSLIRSTVEINSKEYYDLIDSITIELSTIDPKKITSVTKKLEKYIPVMLTEQAKEAKALNRLKILKLLEKLHFDLVKPELFEFVFQALIEAINWDASPFVREEAAVILYDHLFLQRLTSRSNPIFIHSLNLLIEDYGSLISIYEKDENSSIKIRIAALLSIITRELFRAEIQKPAKEQYEIHHCIFPVIMSSFALKKLDHPRKDIFINLKQMLTTDFPALKNDSLKFELITKSINQMLMAHETLPIVYYKLHINILTDIALSIGESLAERIIVKLILLQEFSHGKSIEDDITNSLKKLAHEFGYGYKNKLLSKYEWKVNKEKEQTRKKFLTQQHAQQKACSYCGEDIEMADTKCSNCGELIIRCSVCKLPIAYGREVGICPKCGCKGHYDHFVEWIRTQGKCPSCLQVVNRSKITKDIID